MLSYIKRVFLATDNLKREPLYLCADLAEASKHPEENKLFSYKKIYQQRAQRTKPIKAMIEDSQGGLYGGGSVRFYKRKTAHVYMSGCTKGNRNAWCPKWSHLRGIMPPCPTGAPTSDLSCLS